MEFIGKLKEIKKKTNGDRVFEIIVPKTQLNNQQLREVEKENYFTISVGSKIPVWTRAN